MAPPHVFFASYATKDNRENRLREVVNDLAGRVADKLGAQDAEDVCFFALYDGIKSGQDWERALGDAARKAHVFVCFCSNRYFNSEYCAKEFEVFRRRLENAGPGADLRVVIPVVWETGAVPEAVSRFQVSSIADGFPDDYRQQGLHALRRTQVVSLARYEATLDALTVVISRAVRPGAPRLPAMLDPIDFDTLPDGFDNPGPYGVRLGALHDQGMRWTLAPELGITLRRVAEDVATRMRVHWQVLRVDDRVGVQLAESEKNREAVVLVAESAALNGGAWGARAKAIDRLAGPNCCLLVGLGADAGPATSEQDAQAKVAALAPRLAAAGRAGWFIATSSENLERRLDATIAQLRMSLIAGDPPVPVSDPNLAGSALDSGIVVDRHPAVAGPGGQP